jgi:aquaporin Z
MLAMNKRALLAEFMGTFAMVFFGTGAAILEELHPGSVTGWGVAGAFGLVIMVMIYVFGPFSGAHFNPAVSMGFLLTGAITGVEFGAYLVAQFAGGIAASSLLAYIFPQSVNLGGTFFTIGLLPAFVLEVLLTFFLMLVILRISAEGNWNALLSGFVIGSTVCLAALVVGPLTGASMNPARSLGPALAAGRFEGLWIYLTAPFLGAAIAVGVDRIFQTGKK